MKKFLIYGSGVLFVILGLALIVPYFISLDGFKKTFTETYHTATGQELKLNGPLTFSLLPRPQITLKEVSIFSPQDAPNSPLASMERITLKISLIGLMHGKLVISSIHAETPLLNLKKEASGKGNWEILPPPSPASTLNEASLPEATPSTPSSSSPKLPFQVDTITLHKGHISYKDTEQSTSVENIDLALDLTYTPGKELFLKDVDFELSSLIFNEKLNLKGTLKNLHQENSPLSARLDFYDEHMILEGTVSLTDFSFLGKASLKGNLSESRLLSKVSLLFKSKENPYLLEASFKANPQAIVFSHLSLVMGPLKGEGHGKFDFQKGSPFLEMTFAPGNLSLKLSEKESDGKILPVFQITSKNLIPLLDLLTFDTKDVSPSLFQDFSLSTILDSREKSMSLKNLDLKIGGARLSGYISLFIAEKNPRISYDISVVNLGSLKEFSSLKPVLDFLGNTLHLKGESSRDESSYTTKTLLSTPLLTAKLHGNATPGKNIHLLMTSSGKSLSQLLKQPTSQLGAYDLTMAIEGDLSNTVSLKISPSHLTIGQKPTTFQGDISLSLHQSLPKIKGNLIVDALDLNAFSSASSAPRSSRHSSRPSHSSSSTSRSTPSSHEIWSHTPLNLDFLTLLEGEMDISLQKVTKDAFVFDNLKGHIHLEKGTLTLSPCTGNGLGGSLTATISLSSQRTHPFLCKGALKGVRLKNLDVKQGDFKLIGGTLDLTVDLASQGPSIADHIGTLSGDLKVQAQKGKISGFNLSKAVHALNQAQNIQGFLSLLDSSFSGGETDFNQLEVLLLFQKGVGSLEKCSLTSDVGHLSATGFIDLPHYTLNIIGKAQLNVKNLPAFNVKLSGPLDAPHHELDTQSLQNYLMTHAVGSIVNTILDVPGTAVNTILEAPGDAVGLVQDVLGLGGSSKTPSKPQKTSSNNTSSNPPSSDNPLGDIVQGGLKLFGL